jgi:hypothetical protein
MGQGSTHDTEVGAIILSCSVAAHDLTLIGCVHSVAHSAARPVRPLLLQALLQLPRIADSGGFVSVPAAETLLAELVHELPVNSEWFVRDSASSPRSLVFHEVDVGRACAVMEQFHYLRSPRQDGRAYGLSTQSGQLVALCVSSPLDVTRLVDLLVARGRSMYQARTISRVFAFEGAPKNSISYLLSRLARAERRLGVSDFVTYVNPNMGFDGSSYRASGWYVIGDEPGTTYRYLDNRYATDRSLAAQFGQHDDLTYRKLLGLRFAVSTMPLKPLLVFHNRIDGIRNPSERG